MTISRVIGWDCANHNRDDFDDHCDDLRNGITHFLQRKRKTIRTHSSLARTTDTHYVYGCAQI